MMGRVKEAYKAFLEVFLCYSIISPFIPGDCTMFGTWVLNFDNMVQELY